MYTYVDIEPKWENVRKGDLVWAELWYEAEPTTYRSSSDFGDGMFGHDERNVLFGIKRRVPSLPTEPGVIIKATADGQERILSLQDPNTGAEYRWLQLDTPGMSDWFRDEDIDRATVRIGRIVFEGDES